MSNRACQKLRLYRRAHALDNVALAGVCRVPVPTLQGWLNGGKRPRAATMADLEKRGIVDAADWYAPEVPSEVFAWSPPQAAASA